MRTYTQLTDTDRIEIYALLQQETAAISVNETVSGIFSDFVNNGQLRFDNFGRINDIDAGSGYIHFSYDYVDKENNIEKKYFHHRGVNVYNTYSYDDIDRLHGSDVPRQRYGRLFNG